MKQIVAAAVLCLCASQVAWAQCVRYGALTNNQFFEGVVSKVEVDASLSRYAVYLDAYKDATQQAHTCGKFYIGIGLSTDRLFTPEIQASAAKIALTAFALNQFIEGYLLGSLDEFSYGSTLSLKRR